MRLGNPMYVLTMSSTAFSMLIVAINELARGKGSFSAGARSHGHHAGSWASFPLTLFRGSTCGASTSGRSERGVRRGLSSFS